MNDDQGEQMSAGMAAIRHLSHDDQSEMPSNDDLSMALEQFSKAALRRVALQIAHCILLTKTMS